MIPKVKLFNGSLGSTEPGRCHWMIYDGVWIRNCGYSIQIHTDDEVAQIIVCPYCGRRIYVQ